jgi:ubiquinone/menaquinone biosynthesis C-methylase UbiE
MKLAREGYQYKAKKKYRDVRIAERYDQTRFTGLLGRIKLIRDRALVSRALREAAPIDCLLDLPCGTGRFVPVLEELAGRVVSADISLEMMGVATSRFPGARASFVQCSVERLPFPDSSFDLTFTARFLLHLPPDLRQAALSELSRVSKRWVFFDCLMETGPKGWLRRLLAPIKKGRKPKKRMGREELSRVLDQAGLEIHSIYRPSRIFSEKWMVLCEKRNS